MGEFEQLVLLALVRRGNDAYGMTVRQEIERRTGRDVSIGAVYTTLDRLERKGFVAHRIRQIAVEAGIPIVEKKSLARALNQLVEVGHEIPAQLYKAVAEVLAYVYELSGKRKAQAGVSA